MSSQKVGRIWEKEQMLLVIKMQVCKGTLWWWLKQQTKYDRRELENKVDPAPCRHKHGLRVTGNWREGLSHVHTKRVKRMEGGHTPRTCPRVTRQCDSASTSLPLQDSAFAAWFEREVRPLAPWWRCRRTFQTDFYSSHKDKTGKQQASRLQTPHREPQKPEVSRWDPQSWTGQDREPGAAVAAAPLPPR